MRLSAVLVLALGSTIARGALPAQAMIAIAPAPRAVAPTIIKAEYYCSPGFVPSYGRCIATAASDEVELFLNDSGYDEQPAPARLARHHRRHHGLHERY